MQYLKQNILNSIKGDRDSQRYLYEYTYASIAGVVSLYVKDYSQRDWVFNIGMLKVYNSLKSFDMNTNYLAWARTILVRSAIDHYRADAKKRTIMVPLTALEYTYRDTSMDAALNKLHTEDIVKIIDTLDENQRIVFSLFELEGYSHREIEKQTGIKQNTSKWLLAKARNTLKNNATILSYTENVNNGK